MSLLMTMLSFFFRDSTNMTAFLSRLVIPKQCSAAFALAVLQCALLPLGARQAGKFGITSLLFIVNRGSRQSRIAHPRGDQNSPENVPPRTYFEHKPPFRPLFGSAKG